MGKKQAITIIIVNYNVKEFLANCLLSIRNASKGLDVRCIVVDNDSSDGSVAFIKEHFPTVDVIANRENIGFGKANNQAIEQVDTEYTFLLNPDTLLEEHTLHTMLEHMNAHPECGACGCKILNPDGSFAPESRRSVPTLVSAMSKAFGLTSLFPKSRFFAHYYVGWKDENEPSSVEVLSGSCMFFRTEVLKAAGGFDERFFMYGEDIDLSYRVSKLGYRIDYVPETSIIHYKGESTKKGNLQYVKLFNKAMYQFFDKHYSAKYSGVFRFLVKSVIQVRAIGSYVAAQVRKQKLLITDLVLVLLALTVGFAIRLGESVDELFLLERPDYLWLYLILLVSYPFFLHSASRHSASPTPISASLKAVVYSFITLTVITFFVRNLAFSRVILGSGVLLASVAVPAVRLFRANRLRNRKAANGRINPVRMLIVGNGNSTQKLLQKIRNRVDWQVEIVGIATQNAHDNPASTAVPVLGSLSKLTDIVRVNRIDTVLFSLADVPHADFIHALKEMHEAGVHADVKVIPDEMNFFVGKADVEYLENVPLYDVHLSFLTRTDKVMKRLFDLLLAVPVVLLLLPIAAVIRLLAEKSEWAEYDFASNGTEILFRYLNSTNRSAGIYNLWRVCLEVVKGSISLVGSDLSELQASQKSPELKPGITGYGQVHGGRGVGKAHDEHYTLFYLQHYSLWLDIDILLRTLTNRNLSLSTLMGFKETGS
ncbi:MAG: glycosyltransferase [Balneolaceae bacterium]